MKQEILIKEFRTFLNRSAESRFLNEKNETAGPYPDILPVILHKLKNKLTPILGYAQILRMRNHDGLLTEKIEKIERNASELTELFDNLKDSIIPGRPVMRKQSLNNLILSESTLFDQARENGIKLDLKLDQSIPSLCLNSRQVSLLLKSLVQNSITAVNLRRKDQGKIEISTGTSKEGVFLKIRDNGIGINQSELDQIWKPFFSRFPGKGGIGLLAAEMAVSVHRGNCRTESIPGDHTEFTITFPEGKETGTKPLRTEPLKVLLFNFLPEETDVLKSITGDSENIHLVESAAEGLLTGRKPGVDVDLVFINTENMTDTEIKNIPRPLNRRFGYSSIYLIHGKEITPELTSLAAENSVEFISNEIKTLTIINILATAMNKED